MNFILIIIYGYILVAGILIALFWRDQKIWRGPARWLARNLIVFLTIGILVSLSATLIYPNILIVKTQTIKLGNLNQPINIALITDIQAGNHKKTAWVEKIVKKVEAIKPDLIILDGDLIDNEGNTEDESRYLKPLTQLVGRYPIYAIMGNHEYGIGNATREHDNWQTGDRSAEVVTQLQKMQIPILRNQLTCPMIKNQKVCLFGIDDIWSKPINFDELKDWDITTPMIFLTHNPDGIILWPKNIKAPNLVLAGHTHGGQVWLPGIGPLGSAGVVLGDKYYRGLNYWNNIPIFTSVGAGESGGPIRFWVTPEVALVELK